MRSGKGSEGASARGTFDDGPAGAGHRRQEGLGDGIGPEEVDRQVVLDHGGVAEVVAAAFTPALLISMSKGLDLVGSGLNLRRAGDCPAFNGLSLGRPGGGTGSRAPAYTCFAPRARASAASACPMPALAPVTRTALPAIAMRVASQIGLRSSATVRSLRSRAPTPWWRRDRPEMPAGGANHSNHRRWSASPASTSIGSGSYAGGDVVTALVGLGDLLAGQLVAGDLYRPPATRPGSSAAAAATAPMSSTAIIWSGFPLAAAIAPPACRPQRPGVMNWAKLFHEEHRSDEGGGQPRAAR